VTVDDAVYTQLPVAPCVTFPMLGDKEHVTWELNGPAQALPAEVLHVTVEANDCCCVSSSVAFVGKKLTETFTGVTVMIPLSADVVLIGLPTLVTLRLVNSDAASGLIVTMP
jgi:hypothetical protein